MSRPKDSTSSTTGVAKPVSLAPIGRTLAILRKLIPASRWVMFSELRSIEPNFSAASLSRLLKALQAEGLVEKDERTGLYRMGKDFLTLARASIGALPIHEIIQPVINALAAETRQSVGFFQCDGTGAILTAKCEIEEGFHHIPLGQRMAGVLAHGFGQVIVAYASPERRAQLFAEHAPVPTPQAAYKQRLAAILKGVCHVIDFAPRASINRIVAPVFRGEGGELAGVMGISYYEGASLNVDIPAMETTVRDAARRATAMLSTGTGSV